MNASYTIYMLLALLAGFQGLSAATLDASSHQRSLQGPFFHMWGQQTYYTPAPGPAPGPAQAPTGPPVVQPRQGLGGLKQDIHEALRCQLVYSKQYGGDPNRLRAALGPACNEATLNPIQCCLDSVTLLSSPPLQGCICNYIVYNTLCGQLNVAGQNCQTLLPTLKACGLQCPA